MTLRKWLVAAASIMLAGGVVGLAAPAGATTTTINVANDHAVCNTVNGTITFGTALKLSGPTTGSNSVKLVVKLAGCTDTDNGTVKMFTGSFTTTVTTSNGSNCTGLSGVSSLPATPQILWKPATGQAFTPTALVGTAQKPVSNVTDSQSKGGTFTVPAADAPWASSYGLFQVGSAFGTTATSGTVDFTGGDGGAAGWFSGTTNADTGALLGACVSSAGLKTLTFGIGALAAG